MKKFFEQVSDPFFELFVKHWSEDFSMEKLIKRSKTFRHTPTARYDTEVTFQLSVRPLGNV